MASGSQYERNPRQAGEGTVPKDNMAPPVHPLAYGPEGDTPMIPPHGQSVPPAKPSASTGPGGPSISVPVPGKSGK